MSAFVGEGWIKAVLSHLADCHKLPQVSTVEIEVVMPEVQNPTKEPETNKEYDRFKAALSAIVKVKKEDVDLAIEQERSAKSEHKSKKGY